MATANKNNIVKWIDVGRKLTFGEMDGNFEQLKLTIADTATIEGQLANKVEQSVYDTKIAEIDNSITTLETSSVSSGRIDTIDNRVTVNETDISTLQTNVSSNDTDIANLDSRITSNDVDIAKTLTWTSISTSQTLSENTQYLVDFTSGPLTLTLPLSPATNDFVRINKNDGNSTNSIIARNGQTIMGLAENMTIDYNVVSVNLVYNGTDWRIV